MSQEQADSTARLKRAVAPRSIYAGGDEGALAGTEMAQGRTNRLSLLEHEMWLIGFERRVIIPVKWLIWAMLLVFWHSRQTLGGLPELLIFAAFVSYFMANLGFTYLALVSGIAPSQARAYSLTSLLMDVVFVSLVVYADAQQVSPAFEADFPVFIILMIMRGLAVLRGAPQNLMFGIGMTVLLLVVSRMHTRSFDFLIQWEFALRLGVAWVTFCIGWFLISSVKSQQRELIAMRERLVRSENLAVLGEVSAGIAHELNNPLGIITACADYLASDKEVPASMREELASIQSEARRCKRIVQDLLDFAAPEQSTEIRRVDLRDFCDELIDRLIRDWPTPHPIIRLLYPDELPLISAEPHRLTQALVNVLNNAQQHVGPAGRIEIQLSSHTTADQRWVKLAIADNGPGISPRDLPLIFKPFYSRRKGGTGLGLPIARRIARAHRGELACESSPARGAVMVFTFPALANHPPVRRTSPEAVHGQRSGETTTPGDLARISAPK